MKEWEGMSDNARAYWALYSGKREILGTALIDHDPGDQFAWCQGWRFALCDYLTFVLGENVPDFHPSPFGPAVDAYEYEELIGGLFELDECLYALKILDRYREWLRLAGMDY